MMKELNKNSLEKYAADGKMVLVEFSACLLYTSGY